MFATVEIPKYRKRVRYNIPEPDLAEGAIASPIEYHRPTDEETEEALQRWLVFARKCSVISKDAVIKFDPYEFQKDAFQRILAAFFISGW